MQSEPSDISNTITHTIPERLTQSSQHGFSDPDIAALAASSYNERPQPVVGTPAIVALQSVDGAEGGLVGELPRLNGVFEGDNLPHPSTNAAAGGEIDLGPESPKNRRSGPGFKVTKSRTNSSDGIQLEQFPNGESIRADYGRKLIPSRGPDSHLVAFTRNISVNGIPCVSTVL